MLAKELLNIDSEIIFDSWRSGLQKAQGDFICLLEFDSAVSAGSIARQLQPFMDNPRFRKLAMVAPLVEFDDTELMSLDGFRLIDRPPYPQLARLACVGGAIIRRSSLLKQVDVLEEDLTYMSHRISTSFWENGLRVIADPTSIYYSPQNFRQGTVVAVSEPLMALWQRECIS